MKILWINPAFLDYRVPVYKKIYDLTNGNFYLIYSRKRVPERVIDKINVALGSNAIGLRNEVTLRIPSTGKFEDTDLKFPYQPGLYEAISKIEADVIIAEGFFQWTPAALLRAKLKGIKFFIAYERTAHAERSSPYWRVVYRKLISKMVDGFSVNGQLTKEYLIQLGVSEHKIFPGGMSADSENLVISLNSYSDFERNVLKSELILRSGLTYLYVGQFTERKGVIYLLNAWKEHVEKYPDDNLLAIGTGPLYQQYLEEFSTCDSIKIVGSINYDHIYRFYAIADVFIIPTLEDNWSLVVPEAMACGLPIACSIYNGCYPELVHEGKNGKLFDPLKQDTILETLEYFHFKNLKFMGEESIKIEKNFNADIVANNIYQSIENVI